MVFEFLKCSSDETSSLPFPLWFKWKHIGEIVKIGDTSTKFFLFFVASYWFTGWTLDSYKSILQGTICFSKLLKVFKDRGVKVKFVCDPRIMNMFLLFHRNLFECSWGHFENYWRVFYVILNKSPKSSISPICFQLNQGEDGKHNISSRIIFKVKKNQ